MLCYAMLCYEALANATGNGEAVPALRARGDAAAAAVNAVLWDEATGIYRQVDA